MTNHVKLDNVDHADVAVAIRHGATYGDAVNQLLVFPSEFEQLQREFPILFRRDERSGFYAVVLLGLDLDENLFLGADGWTTRYVPAVQQRGPFTLAAGDSPAVHIDLADPRVNMAGGEPLFLRHGGDAPYLKHVTTVLDALRRGAEGAAPFFAALEAEGLIRAVTLDIAIDDETRYQIDAVYTVDEAKLAALGGAALERLHASGILRAATMAAASLANVPRLIELKTARRAAR
jgi:hypothetical protein